MGGCRSRDGRPRWASAVELGGGREKEMRSQTSLRHTEASRRPPAGTRHRACAVAATRPRAQVESVVVRWAPAGHPTRRPLGTRSPGSTQGGLDTPQTPAEPQGCPGIASALPRTPAPPASPRCSHPAPLERRSRFIRTGFSDAPQRPEAPARGSKAPTRASSPSSPPRQGSPVPWRPRHRPARRGGR